MNHWWRAYNEAVNDPKLQLISDSLFRAWFNLMCIASGNDGALPAIPSLAFTLRMKPEQVAKTLTQLHAAGLLDKTAAGFVPHNWTGRQYKSDKPDETAAERMRRYRERNRVSKVTVTDRVTDRNDRNGDVTVTVPREQIQNTEQIDRIGDAGASSFTEGSKNLSDAFWKALGFGSSLDIPPELAGADWRALSWETAGWTADLIASEVRRIGPGKPLIYYEKVFATEFAKRQAPLPIVEIRPSEKVIVNGTNKIQSGGGSITASIRRDLAALEQSEGADLALPTGSILRLSN